jgi:hypothetical protein
MTVKIKISKSEHDRAGPVVGVGFVSSRSYRLLVQDNLAILIVSFTHLFFQNE